MENDFFIYLRKEGRSENAANRITAYAHEFDLFLNQHRHRDLETASPADLEAFVTHLEQQPKGSAKGQLWGLGYYFAFTTNENLRQLARMLREQRMLQRPCPLREFRGLSPAVVEQLAANGIIHVKHMLTAGNTAAKRAALATSTGVPELVILEIVKLADLARIPGVKGIRARLYHDAGVDTLAKLAQWEPELLREMLVEFVTQTGFEGLAPHPSEVKFTITQAQQLPKKVDF